MGQKYTQEEKDEAIFAYMESGLTLTEYCMKYQIPSSTFRDWIKIYNKNIHETQGFGQINIEQNNCNKLENTMQRAKLLISFNNENIRVELKEGFDKKLLKNIVKAVLKC